MNRPFAPERQLFQGGRADETPLPMAINPSEEASTDALTPSDTAEPQAAVVKYLLELEGPLNAQPRWGHGKPSHPQLNALIEAHLQDYEARLDQLSELLPWLSRLPLHNPPGHHEPHWINNYLPTLDAVMWYAMMAWKRPSTVLEIGCGHSSRFLHQATVDHQIPCRLIGIDPDPRTSLPPGFSLHLATRLEAMDLSIFDQVQPGDIVSLDGSHRLFPNTDVQVFFLEILPTLPPGTVVHMHDTFLPNDYPEPHCRWQFSEQYMLAMALLTGAPYHVLMPNAYLMTLEGPYQKIMHLCDTLWTGASTDERSYLEGFQRLNASSFWFEIR